IEKPIPTAPAPGPSGITTSFDVGGMTCAACVRRVERALEKVDGVSNINVNLATEKATVEVGQGIDAARIRAVVEKADYTPGEIVIGPPTATAGAPIAPMQQGPTDAEREAEERDRARDAHIAYLKR